MASQMFAMAMPKKLKEIIRVLAAQEQRSLSQMARMLIVEALRARGVKYE